MLKVKLNQNPCTGEGATLSANDGTALLIALIESTLDSQNAMKRLFVLGDILEECGDLNGALDAENAAYSIASSEQSKTPIVPDVLLRVDTIDEDRFKGKIYSAAKVLELLVTERLEQYDEADFKAQCAAYRLAMPTVFTDRQLQQAKQELKEATAIVEANRFWHRAFWIGATKSEFEARKGELEQMLHERAKTNWRFAGIPVQRLLDELVEVEL